MNAFYKTTMGLLTIGVAVVFAIVYGCLLTALLIKKTSLLTTRGAHVLFIMVVVVAMSVLVLLTTWSLLDPHEYREYIGATLNHAHHVDDSPWRSQSFILNSERRQHHIESIKDALRSDQDI